MDEFGVLTERFGLKPQGKSAPMAASKLPTSSNTFQSRNSGFNSGENDNISSHSGFVDVSFQKNTKSYSYGGLDDYDDVFGSLNKSTKHSGSGASSFGYDSIFFGSNNSDPAYDDIFGGMPKSSVTAKTEDLARSFSSSLDQTTKIDLLGDFGRNVSETTAPKLNGLKQTANSAAPFDELISGFGKSSSRINGANSQNKPNQQSTSHTTKSTFNSAKDPFIELESTSTPSYNSSETFSDPLEEFSKFNSFGGTELNGSSKHSSSPFRVPPAPKAGHKVKSSSSSSKDGLEDFARGIMRNNGDERKVNFSTRKVNGDGKEADSAGVNQHNIVDDLDSIFSMGSRSKSVPRSRTSTVDPLFDIPKYNKPPEIPKGTSAAPSNIKKSSSAVNLVDDLTSMFNDASLFGDFQEIEGENEERRRARLERQQRTQERAARALADLNQRDFQTQHEQEEKSRIAESLGTDIKQWAAGKEGNMRALLSTLQHVLWPDCGWEPVPLTEMITSSSVRKVYRKAVLCIHPDKVQQKGASLEQKYTSEKVFDILKEAWNKFSKEEL